MKTGDLVRKKTGYKYVGYIVADFTKTTGQRRFVVECMNTGMLHIFNENQLEPADENEDKEVLLFEEAGVFYLIPFYVHENFLKDYSNPKVTKKEFDRIYNQYKIEEVAKKSRLYLKDK